MKRAKRAIGGTGDYPLPLELRRSSTFQVVSIAGFDHHPQSLNLASLGVTNILSCGQGEGLLKYNNFDAIALIVNCQCRYQ